MPVDLPDFDTLKTLAEEDIDAFEALRERHIQALIDSAPVEHRRRLIGLQFQIDSIRRLSKNPTQACIKISQMMHDSFLELQSVLLDYETSAEATGTFEATRSAEIIKFPK